MFEALPDGLLMLDEHDRVTEANPRAEVIFESGPAALIGAAARDLLGEPLGPGPLWNGRVSAASLAGRKFPAEISSTILPAGGRLLLVRDVTEVAGLEIQLRQAQKMESLGRLTGGIAHDFNNYLTVVMGEADLMRAGEPVPAEVLGRIRDSASKAAELTSKLLAFGRKQVFDKKIVDLNRLMTSMDGLLRNLVGADIRLVSVHGAHVGSVSVDAAQFEQALVNLAVNARDAMSMVGTLRIETSAESLDAAFCATHKEISPGDYVVIALTDSGTGMTEDVIEHIFEPFYTTKPRGRGTGLGLAMVMGFAQQSGGTVVVDSRPGVGTTMRLYLPAATANAVAEAEVVPVDSEQENLCGGECVLIAEDDELVRRFTESVLTQYGYRVISCGGADHALAALDDQVDLLLTDIVMPGGSGLDLARRARGQFPDLPVLYMSGFVDQSFVEGGDESLAVETLRKPFGVKVLLRAVRAKLEQAVTAG